MMGASESIDNEFELYRRGLAEVDQKAYWKEDLMIDVYGAPMLVVYYIESVSNITNEIAGDLKTNDNYGYRQYIYYYSGNKIITSPSISTMHRIYLRKLDMPKLGGARKGKIKHHKLFSTDIERVIKPEYHAERIDVGGRFRHTLKPGIVDNIAE